MDNAQVEDANFEEEERRENSSKFSDIKIRNAFMRKVFLIVAAQLIITCVIIAPMLLHEPTRQRIRGDLAIFIASSIIFVAIYIAIVFCAGIRHRWPQNYIVLFIMTVATAVWLGIACAHFDFQQIFLALGICVLLLFALTVFSLQTRIDFTRTYGILLVFFVALFALCILFLFFPRRGLFWIILIGAIVLLSISFIADVQLITGGNHRYSLSPEEYILAATIIYIDIVYIFYYVLLIVLQLNK